MDVELLGFGDELGFACWAEGDVGFGGEEQFVVGEVEGEGEGEGGFVEADFGFEGVVVGPGGAGGGGLFGQVAPGETADEPFAAATGDAVLVVVGVDDEGGVGIVADVGEGEGLEFTVVIWEEEGFVGGQGGGGGALLGA